MLLAYVPDHFKTEEMCNEAVLVDPWLMYDVPDYLKTQEMCNEVVKKVQWLLFDVPNRFRNLISIRAIHPLRFINLGHPKA